MNRTRPADARPRPVGRLGRWGRLLAAFWLATAVVLGSLVVASPKAFAADAQIDRYTIDYQLQTSGVLEVKETIVYRFGDNSGRHGIDRVLVTREPDAGANADKDDVYDVTQFKASSPDPNVNTDVSKSTESSNGGREVDTTYRIGSANQTVDSDTATYVLTYNVAGAMRSPNGVDQLYWDATGFGWKEQLNQVSVSATVPGGAQNTSCFAGPPKSTTPCTSHSDGSKGIATFSEASVDAGSGLTIAVAVKPGLVSDNQPHLEPSASALTPAQTAGVGVGAGLGLLSLIGSPILGILWFRKRGRDLRFLDVPPGTVAGEGARVGYSPRDFEIPVAFTPPQISVAEAGLLVDGQVDTRETAATLVDLAVRKVIRIDDLGQAEYGVQLLGADRNALAPHENVLIDKIFQGGGPGTAKQLSSQGGIRDAHVAMAQVVRNEVTQRGWFRTVPPAKAAKSVGVFGLIFVGFILYQIAHALIFLVLIAVPVVITVAVVRSKLGRGQRTPVGRAMCDQVDGFKKYLATAEAGQLRFEEGEDIFSRYLPWAIAFDLADRWAKICSQLVEMGRMPNQQPYWYGGTGFNMYSFNTGLLVGSLTNSVAPPPSTGGGGFGGTGFGSGGSGFGGGGFSGGGGGGGGGGGW